MDYDTLCALTDRTVSWKERYPKVAEAIKRVVATAEKPLTTTEVVKALLVGLTKEQTDPHVKDLYAIVSALTKHDLKDWFRLGTTLARVFGGKMAYPRLWQSPEHPVLQSKPEVAPSPANSEPMTALQLGLQCSRDPIAMNYAIRFWVANQDSLTDTERDGFNELSSHVLPTTPRATSIDDLLGDDDDQ